MEPNAIEHREDGEGADRCRTRETRSSHTCAWTFNAKKEELSRGIELDSHRVETPRRKEDRLEGGIDHEEEFGSEDEEPDLQREEESYTMSYLTKKSACLRWRLDASCC